MIGYRIWLLRFDTISSQVRLVSLVDPSIPRSFTWVKEMEAICNQGRLIEHLKANVHGCGVWSLKSLAQAKAIEAEYKGVATIAGAVYSHGTVLEATAGYRASKAIIWQLFWPDWRCRVHPEREAIGFRILGARAGALTPIYPICSRECIPERGEIWGQGIFIDKQRVLDMLTSYYRVPIVRG